MTGGSSGAGRAGTGGQASDGGGGATAASGSNTDAGKAGDGGAMAGAPGLAGETATWSTVALDGFGFALLGSAELTPDGVLLTHEATKGEVGGIAQQTPLELGDEAGLHVAMGFRIEAASSGDGLAIILHASPKGPTALGNAGGGIGYAGISPCFAVELDTAKVGDTELPAPHLAIVPNCVPERHGPSTTALGGNPTDGGDWLLSLDWSASSGLLDVSLRRLSSGHVTSISEPVDLMANLGSLAYVTIAAANGEFTATHSVWSLELSGGGLSSRSLTSGASAPP